MKQRRKIVLVLGKMNAVITVLIRWAGNHKKIHLLFGTALAISLVCCFENTETTIPSLRNTIHSDSTSNKSAFRKEVKVGNHEFVIFVK